MSWYTVAAIGGSAVLGALSSESAADTQAAGAREASAVTKAQYDQTRKDLDPWRSGGQVSLDKLMYLMGLPSGSQALAPPDRAQFTTQSQGAVGQQGGQLFGGQGPQQNLVLQGLLNGRGGVQGGMQGMQGGQQSTFDQAGYDQALAAYQASLGQQQQPQDSSYGSLLRPFSLADFQASPAYNFNLEQGQNAINKGASARGNYYAPQTLQDLGKYSQGMASNEFQNAYSNYNTNMNNVWNRLYGLSGSGQNAAAQLGGFGANAANQVGQNTMGAANAQAAGTMGVNNALQGGIQNAYWQYLNNQQQPNYGGNTPYNPSAGQYGGVI